jgi:hypothetical protein
LPPPLVLSLVSLCKNFPCSTYICSPYWMPKINYIVIIYFTLHYLRLFMVILSYFCLFLAISPYVSFDYSKLLLVILCYF